MQSFLVADADPENYGQLIDFRLPKGEFVDGPSQVATRINQAPDISQRITLLDQQGSSVIKGNLFVVPINQSILYYQPIYLQGEQNPLPEFKIVKCLDGKVFDVVLDLRKKSKTFLNLNQIYYFQKMVTFIFLIAKVP